MVWSGLAECHRRCGQRCCDNTCSPHPHKTLLRTGNATCWRPIAFRKTLRGHLSLCDGRHPAHFRPLCPLSRAPQPDRIFRPRPHSHRIYHNRTLWHIPRPSLGKTRHCATAICFSGSRICGHRRRTNLRTSAVFHRRTLRPCIHPRL